MLLTKIIWQPSSAEPSNNVQNLDDTRYMQLALRLAREGLGKTRPNPMVGAVLVKNGKIIGRGYHKKNGGWHAEIEAINSVRGKDTIQGSTLYVNLEPHGYVGRTLPCTAAIIKAGISRVVCATLDPNPKIQGDGVAQLRKAGIEVSIGTMEKEARLLNEQFFTFHQKKRPFIAIKYATSLDGKLATATGDSKWITNQAARTYGRKLRSQYQAILVGVNTVVADNPHLGARQKSQPDPLRIILGKRSRIASNAHVLRDQNVMVATGSLPKLMTELYKMNVISVLVEGGGEVVGNFIDHKLLDRVYGFYAPLLIGGRQAVSIGGAGAQKVDEALNIQDIRMRHFGDNFLIEGIVEN